MVAVEYAKDGKNPGLLPKEKKIDFRKPFDKVHFCIEILLGFAVYQC